MNLIKLSLRVGKALGVCVIFVGLFAGQKVSAAVTGTISITFDDGWLSQYQYAGPIVKAAQQRATIYIPNNLIGTLNYMTWENLVSMANEGWEVGGHTADHLELPTLTPDQIAEQIRNNYAVLEAHGFIPMSFASPFGAYNSDSIADAAFYYQSHRGFHDIGYNAWPYNQYVLQVQQVTNVTTLAEVETWVQQAQADKTWLIIVFHGILPTVAADDTYSWTTTNLQSLLEYLNASGIKTRTIGEVLNMRESIFLNSDFHDGIADGWSTPNPDQVKANYSGAGAVPTPLSSIEMTGGTTTAILQSPIVPVVTSTDLYGLRVFINGGKFVSGEVGFYVDEYDQNNQLIFSKFLATTTPELIIDESYSYTISSASTTAIGLRVYMSAGSVGTMYIDNFSFFPSGEGSPLPIPHPISSLANPLPISNTDFDNGIANGWTTNSSTLVTLDSSGRGLFPTTTSSIKMQGSASPAYLFSPKAQVMNRSYTASVFTDAAGLTTGEVGFYIDEYDNNDAWISGRWLGLQPSGNSSTLFYSYVPTSPSVNSAALQVYLTASSTGDVYVDNFELNLPPAPVELPLPNADFDNGLANGWTTNNDTQVTFDTDFHGLTPTPTSSIRMQGGSQAVYLFGPKALVTSTSAYNISVFSDAGLLTTGEIGYYVDEYGANDAWVSGRWLGLQLLGTSSTLSFSYLPSSSLVNSAALQVYLTGNSTGEVFIDNLEMSTVPLLVTPEPPLPNSDFDNGLADGWSTNNADLVTLDSDGHGLNPTPTTTIRMQGGAQAAYLFSPKAHVTSSLYTITAFADATLLTTGEVGYYIDEYDAVGAWISGQWLGQQLLGSSSTLSFTYIPTTVQVKSVALQAYLTASSTGDVFIDNYELSTPSSTPLPPLPAPPVELPLPNTNFDNGLADGWTTNSSTLVTLDTDNHGSAPTPTTSIRLQGDSQAVYLFSPQALITSTAYTVSVYADTSALTSGEVGYFVDEYNASGAWISGKWLGQQSLGTSSTQSFSYLPTSSTVKSAALQVYLAASSTGVVYLDNVELSIAPPLPPPPLPPIQLPLPNTNFDNGLSEGWTTNSSTLVTLDTTGRGLTPTPSSTIKMLATADASFLFSPKVFVASSTYTISLFADASLLTAGEVGYFVDEYDANGAWISGKWLGYQPLGTASTSTYSYVPTSSAVTSAALQIYLNGGSVGEVYLDNVEIIIVN